MTLGIEIERKFLLKNDAWRSEVTRSVRMAQGYINDQAAMRTGAQKCSVRVRIAGEQAFLNMKSREVGAMRQEFDYPIPVADAEKLLKLCVGGLIDKTRHYIPMGELTWEIDEFFAANQGLLVAELELPAVDHAFSRPEWLGNEVTESLRYYNLALAERPYSQWTNEEKQGC
jgi:adenylate cyclase